MRLLLLLVFVLGASCATTTPQQATATTGCRAGDNCPEPGFTPEAGVSAEQYEQIDNVFKRKTAQLYGCWQEEFARTNDRKLQGDLMIALIVQTSGNASNVKILKSTIASPDLQACVVKEVSGWSFPELSVPAPYRRMVHLGAEF